VPTVFVSYARADLERVRPLTQMLANMGVKVWIDLAAMRGGDDFAAKIAAAIRAADIFLVFLSRAAFASEYVAKELRVAAEFGCPIVPVWLEVSPTPDHLLLHLCGLHRLDVSHSPAEFAEWSRTLVSPRTPEFSDGRIAPDYLRTRALHAPLEHVFKVAAKFEQYPRWHKGVKAARTTASDEQGRASRVEWTVGVGPLSLKYTMRYLYRAPYQITWVAEPTAQLKEMAGTYEFEAIDAATTKAACSLRIRGSNSVPEWIVHQITQLVTQLRLDELGKECERHTAFAAQ